MPKTAMDENDLLAAGKYEIGPSRESLAVKAIPVALSVGHPPHDHFRYRILAAHASHQVATLLRRQFIDHPRP
jgi:hypothetical protein